MIYSIGDEIDFNKLHWSSDWDSKDIFGEDYPHEFAIGFYLEIEKHDGQDISYYIDLRKGTVMTIFFENEEDEDVETIWDERYFV